LVTIIGVHDRILLVTEVSHVRRYKKIKEDMPLSAAKIEDNTFGCWSFAS